MNIVEFTNSFLDLERRLELFSVPDWDPLRYDLFYCAYHTQNKVAGMPEAPARRLGRYLRRAAGRAQRKLMRQQLLRRLAGAPRDVLILQASRQRIDGNPTDPAIAPLAALVGTDAHVIDSVPRYYHLPETGMPRILPVAPEITEMTYALARLTGGRIKAEALSKLAAGGLAQFRRRLAGYHHILDAARPKLIIVNQNGSEKPLFRAAHQRGLPVVETQHGLIGYGHPSYSYAPDLDYRAQDTFPDVFVTFSNCWMHGLHYPVQRIVPLGNNAMMPPPAAVDLSSDVMVISADIYHETLSKWTRQVATAQPYRKFLYKLHPNQQSTASDIAQAMADLPNICVIDGSVKASDFLGRVGHLIVVQSTVMYEALQMGIPLSIVVIQNYDIGRHLFNLPQVAVVETPEALAGRINAARSTGAGPTFFAPFQPDAARALIQELIYSGRPAENWR